jgi:glycosyltransferase involved in cell wall biosynthesis
VYYFVCRLAPLLQERGHEVAVVAPSESLQFTQQKIDNIDVYGVPSLPVFYYPGFRVPVPLLLRRRIRRILDRFKPDVIHIQDHFLLARTVVELNGKEGVFMVGTNHFMPENLTAFVRSEKWKKQLERIMWARFVKVYNRLSIVTTPTETAARLIRPKLDTEVVAISSGIDLQQFDIHGDVRGIREKYGIPEKPVVLFVGRLDPEKRIEELLQAVALAVRVMDLCFVIVGKGFRKAALERLAGELGISDRVIFTGFVPEEDLPYLYKCSQCFVIASTAELLSLATLQAMASGLPVIAVRAGALGELVQDKANGFLFDAGDVDAIARGIWEIIGNDGVQRKMGKRSLDLASCHAIQETVTSFESVYHTSKHEHDKTNTYAMRGNGAGNHRPGLLCAGKGISEEQDQRF